MAKPKLRIKAREMRKKGESVNLIAKELDVSKGTVSLWVRDIILSVEQLEELKKRSIKGGELGRLKGALMQKNRRLRLIDGYKKKGIKKFKNISKEEQFVAGVALYWAEGAKKTREVRFCNSDPKLVNLMIAWFEEFFNVDKKRLSICVGINEIHRSREEIVKNYWSDITSISIEQFKKTSFKKTKNKKVYANYDKHYGTLDVRVLKPGELYYKIMGLIHGLSMSG